MRKVIANDLVALALVCATVLLLSACTLFSGSRAVSDRNAPLFRGRINPQPGDGESHYLTGCVFQEKKKHRLAVEEFKLAVACDSANAAAHNGLGVSLDALGDHDGAVTAYTAALAVDPNRDYVLNNLGYSYLLQDRPDLAVACFQKAVALDGQNRRYSNNLGLAYARSGNYDAALAAFKAGGDEAKAHLNVARLYYRDGLYEKAGVHFARASALKPSDTETDKGLSAALSLAQIHSDPQKPPETKEAPPVRKERQQTVRQDHDGFSTIPAGAIQDLKVKIDRVWLVENSVDSANETEDRPIHTAAMTRIASHEEEREAARKDLEDSRLKVLDEMQALELVRLEGVDGDQRPIPRIKIEVSNGNGVRLMARRVGDYLRDKGFIPMYLSNARHFDHAETSITYTRGYLREAWRLSRELPGLQSLEEVAEIRGGHAEISVLIGRDLTEYSSLFEQG